jgi:hypothetical protein
MLRGGEGRRTRQVESLASAPILNSQNPALRNIWPLGFCSRRQAPRSCIQSQNERLLSFHHGVPLHLRPAVLPGFALRVENDVTHSKHSSVAQSTRGQNRTLGPRKLGKSKRTPKISNRELTMRRASASRVSAPRRTTRGICSALSNRELQLLELDLTYRKQSTGPRSNRELSTIVSNASHSYKLEIIRTGELPRG